MITVANLLIDDANEPKFWSHGIIASQVAEVQDNDPIITRNRRMQAAEYILIGRDDSGRCIAIPIVPTHDPSIWRPLSAWYCKPSEVTKLRQFRTRRNR